VAGFILDISSLTFFNLKISKTFLPSVLVSVYHPCIMKYSLCLAASAFCDTEVVAFLSRMFALDMNENERRALEGIATEIEPVRRRSA